jgi:hypothetical protein
MRQSQTEVERSGSRRELFEVELLDPEGIKKCHRLITLAAGPQRDRPALAIGNSIVHLAVNEFACTLAECDENRYVSWLFPEK